MPKLVVGSDNSLQAFDSKTMLRKWYIAFDTPPVSAYRQDGRGSNCLDPEQGALRLQHGSYSKSLVPRIQDHFLPGHKLKGRLAGGTTVLVGALQGSLYALPADNLMLAAADTDESGGSSTAEWSARTGSLPLDITLAEREVFAAAGAAGAAGGQMQHMLPCSTGGISSQAGCNASCSSGISSSDGSKGSSNGGAVTLVDDDASSKDLVPLEPSEKGLVDELGSLTCPQPPLGIHNLSVQQARPVAWLPNTSSNTKNLEDKSHSVWSTAKLVLTTIVALLLVPFLFGWTAIPWKGTSARAVAMQPMTANSSPAVPGPSPMGTQSASPSPARKCQKRGATKAAQNGSATAEVVADSSQHIGNGGDAVHFSIGVGHHFTSQTAAAAAGSTAASRAGSATVACSLVPQSLQAAASPVPAPNIAAMSDGGVVAATLMQARSYVDEDGAVVIGRLRVGPGILGYGSAGTIALLDC
eukprot:GHRR01014420.1.p1 GENE.GHRR01014420.1~~GHRR01014420.1.p1  ORF type:complete len:470 (+),score=187.68 GHRR01014420.1:1045-2454(+)